MMKWNEVVETVIAMVKKLWVYAECWVHGPTHARISAVVSGLSERLQEMEDKIEDTHQKLKELKEDLLQISLERTRDRYQKQISCS